MTVDVLSSLVRAGKMITAYFLRRKNPGFVAGVVPGENSTRDGPISPRKNLKGYPGLLKLASDVRANYLKGGMMSNERFLPDDKLEELVTKESVLLALQETTIKQQYHEDLATWVLESGKRLFLILVLLTRVSEEQLSWLEDLKNDGISDSALPLGFSEAEPYYGYSLIAEAEGAQNFHSFKDWKDNNLLLFRVYQWIFLAPVFGASTKFRYQLTSEQPLPLLNLVKKPAKSSILREILYGEIHPAHIDSQCLSALGMVGTVLIYS
ncbi:hypothetical protein F4801DRAFT_584826 [Xylaria longipes]|nr:hypothetical protein F4801DRAFT_584826 [Xylaria longipes]RYC63834.1 hypothetical protein CHU98_g2403 [Xylaria longipes]